MGRRPADYDFSVPDHTSYGPETGSDDKKRPAVIASSSYDQSGRPIPKRPEDLAPAGALQDMRARPGAPQGGRTESDHTFYEPRNWMPGNIDGMEDFGDVVTGHEPDTSRLLPWYIFRSAMFMLGLCWILAGVYHALGAMGIFDLDQPLVFHNRTSVTGNHVERYVHPGQRPVTLDLSWPLPVEDSPYVSPQGRKLYPHGSYPTPVGRASFMSWAWSVSPTEGETYLVAPELVQLAWPHPNVMATSLTCDSEGLHFVVTDGVLMYAGDLSSADSVAGMLRVPAPEHQSRPVLEFDEAPCDALMGEGLQDVAISCAGRGGDAAAAGGGENVSNCEAWVLHRNGRRVASCPLPGFEEAPDSAGYDISDTWLEQFRAKRALGGGEQRPAGADHGPHGRIEKGATIAAGSQCGGPDKNCLLLGTTRGRVVELRQHAKAGAGLVPRQVLEDGRGGSLGAAADGGSNTVRHFNDRYLGVLRDGGKTMAVLDGSNGGYAVGHFSLPKTVTSFCSGGGHLYFLGQGRSPKMWRVLMPAALQ